MSQLISDDKMLIAPHWTFTSKCTVVRMVVVIISTQSCIVLPTRLQWHSHSQPAQHSDVVCKQRQIKNDHKKRHEGSVKNQDDVRTDD